MQCRRHTIRPGGATRATVAPSQPNCILKGYMDPFRPCRRGAAHVELWGAASGPGSGKHHVLASPTWRNPALAENSPVATCLASKLVCQHEQVLFCQYAASLPAQSARWPWERARQADRGRHHRGTRGNSAGAAAGGEDALITGFAFCPTFLTPEAL